ncbi:MAG: HlyD family secretion protein [Rhizomicrobium sp.]
MSAPGLSETPAPPPPAQVWHPPARNPLTTVAIAVLALAAILVVLWAWDLWPFGGRIEVTDDAYVRGRTTVIAPQVSGYVAAVPVHDYQQVRAGGVLVLIDDRIYRARVAQAAASVAAAIAALDNSDQAHAARVAASASARAQLLRAQADMARVNDLVRDGSVSIRERDQTLAALAQAQAGGQIAVQDIRSVDVGREGLRAQVEAARAQLRLAEIDLGHTVIRAPETGQLSEVAVRLGQYVTNGTQLFSLVPAERWIIANYKEGQMAHMMPGEPATFTVDALGGLRLTGHVQRLSPAAGSEFAVLKPDNATGNFVKVPQRFGVRIAVDPNQPGADRLRPGMSVETRIDTSGGP